MGLSESFQRRVLILVVMDGDNQSHTWAPAVGLFFISSMQDLCLQGHNSLFHNQ